MNALSTNVVVEESKVQPNGIFSTKRIIHAGYMARSEGLAGIMQVSYRGILADGQNIGGIVLTRTVDKTQARSRAYHEICNEYPSMIAINLDEAEVHRGIAEAE